MFRRTIIIITAIIYGVLSVAAKNLSPEEALQRVLNVPRQSGISSRSVDKKEYSLAYSSPAGSFHVFNRSTGGYIIVSGDDRVCPLLADVTSGTFSNDT